MVICLDSSVISGYLSNEVPGLVTGMLHLAGQDRPLHMELSGNFLRDIAGCRVELHNPIPESDLRQTGRLDGHQQGFVGQMTASYRVLKMPRSRKQAGPFSEPAGLKNLLYLEWFNREKQRVLIQSWHLHMTVSAPCWQLSRPAELAQIRQNRARRKQFLLGVYAGDAFDMDQDMPTNELPGGLTDLMKAAPSKERLEVPPGSGSVFAADSHASGELAQELHRFEMLLNSPGELKSRPAAVLRLLSTAGDLAAHLSHILKRFGSLKSSQWQFLLTDLEQSLPLFLAALTACDKLVNHTAPGTDLDWLMKVRGCLLSTTGHIELLMRWLRDA